MTCSSGQPSPLDFRLPSVQDIVRIGTHLVENLTFRKVGRHVIIGRKEGGSLKHGQNLGTRAELQILRSLL